MALFAVIAPAPSDSLTEAMLREFRDDYFEFAPGQFVLKAVDQTSEQVSKRLGADGENGNFVVFTVGGYWGHHRKNLWEWLSTRAAA